MQRFCSRVYSRALTEKDKHSRRNTCFKQRYAKQSMLITLPGVELTHAHQAQNSTRCFGLSPLQSEAVSHTTDLWDRMVWTDMLSLSPRKQLQGCNHQLLQTFPGSHSVPSAQGVCWVRHPLCAPSMLIHQSRRHCICFRY